ncbi:MAG: HEAT repeat domain-containing protein [Aggregatilineales bacterium]
MNRSDALDRLLEELGSSDTAVHESAETRLESMGAIAVEPLITAMSGENMGKAWRAARILSKIDDPRRFEPMRQALTSKNSLVGQVAVETLEAGAGAGQSMPQTVDAFIRALPNARFLVQLHIVAALERLGDKQAIAPLIDLLRTADSPEQRYMIIQALGTLGATQAIDLIRSFQDDENHHVRERAHVALQRLTDGQTGGLAGPAKGAR